MTEQRSDRGVGERSERRRDLGYRRARNPTVLWDCGVSDDGRYAFVGCIEIDGCLCCKAVLVVEPQERVDVQFNELVYILRPNGECLTCHQAVITPDIGCDWVKIPIASRFKIKNYQPTVYQSAVYANGTNEK